jgi:hypothetical protein
MDIDDITTRYRIRRISVFDGFASISIFGPSRRQHIAISAADGAIADADALRGDWEAIGRDLRAVFGPSPDETPMISGRRT